MTGRDLGDRPAQHVNVVPGVIAAGVPRPQSERGFIWCHAPIGDRTRLGSGGGGFRVGVGLMGAFAATGMAMAIGALRSDVATGRTPSLRAVPGCSPHSWRRRCSSYRVVVR